MAKRGYKLQEFVAHSTGVNCLTLGKKVCKLLVTGGDDNKVNVWAIGRPTSLMSLCGHTTAVESVAFDSTEILVLAGASSGAIKLWDLEETKMVRTLTGHRSNCTAIEFHPFGEFFASGSLDTNLKIWDIRKKGCIHTYKGHTGGINTIRFTPDGRWVVSGGLDNTVKIWDLTAGKLLHDFKLHDGHIQSIDFHPLEFLLATGSNDKTVKFWDLETFEMIGSSKLEATGVRTVNFHPDGRTLFCGFDDCLKSYSWEPVICHDSVDMGWSTLGDLCIRDDKLLGCSYFRNSVGVWVADVSSIESSDAEQTRSAHPKFNFKGRRSSDRVHDCLRSTSMRGPPSDDDVKEIKTIHVDSTGGKPATVQRTSSFNSSRVALPIDSKEVISLPNLKQIPTVETPAKSVYKGFVVPNIVPRDSTDGKISTRSGRESTKIIRTEVGALSKPTHVRTPSRGKGSEERLSVSVEHESLHSISKDFEMKFDSKFQNGTLKEDGGKYYSEEKQVNIQNVPEKFEKALSQDTLCSQRSCNEATNPPRGANHLKSVNGAVRGRIRSIVEKFERKDPINGETRTPVQTSSLIQPDQRIESTSSSEDYDNSEIFKNLLRNHDTFFSTTRSRLAKLQVVRSFWERKDIESAANTMRKMADHCVEADVISVVTEKMDILTLELFSYLLPSLSNLLDAPTERHVNVSLEALLKLVSVFGPVVRSTVSAPRGFGVDLQGEHRLERCNRCWVELKKIEKALPLLMKRSGMVGKYAQELNLIFLDL